MAERGEDGWLEGHNTLQAQSFPRQCKNYIRHAMVPNETRPTKPNRDPPSQTQRVLFLAIRL